MEHNMKDVLRRLGLLICMVTVLSSITLSSTQGRTVKEDLRSRLIGAWRMAWNEELGADGKLHRNERTGILLFTRDGHMSVQIMARDSGSVPSAVAAKYYQGDYTAYYGKYDVDERAHTVTYHVEGALVRTLIGNDLIRRYEISGTQLILKPFGSDENWTFAWEHY